MSITVSRNGKAEFDNFHNAGTQHGTKVFIMPDPTSEGWLLLASDGVPLLAGDDSPLLTSGRWICQFGDTTPVSTVLGVEFVISFPIVVLP